MSSDFSIWLRRPLSVPQFCPFFVVPCFQYRLNLCAPTTYINNCAKLAINHRNASQTLFHHPDARNAATPSPSSLRALCPGHSNDEVPSSQPPRRTQIGPFFVVFCPEQCLNHCTSITYLRSQGVIAVNIRPLFPALQNTQHVAPPSLAGQIATGIRVAQSALLSCVTTHVDHANHHCSRKQ
jgi:hypothetical protein